MHSHKLSLNYHLLTYRQKTLKLKRIKTGLERQLSFSEYILRMKIHKFIELQENGKKNIYQIL